MDRALEHLLDREYSAIEDILIDGCGLNAELLAECGSAFPMIQVLKHQAKRKPLSDQQKAELTIYTERAERLLNASSKANDQLLSGLVVIAVIFGTHLSRKGSGDWEAIPTWESLVEYVSISAYLRGRLAESLRSSAEDIDVVIQNMEKITNLYSSLYLEHLASQAALEGLQKANQQLPGDIRREQARNAGIAKNRPARQAKEFVQSEWAHHKESYGNNKSAFARDYVKRVWNELNFKVTEKQLREVWLAGTPPAGRTDG